MHVKRLYGPTVREALLAAKDELGPDALVLSTELVPATGWRGWIGQRRVRLTAAAERTLSDFRPDLPVERRERVPLEGPRASLVAKLTATGLDLRFAEAVAMRMTEAECRGGSDLALRRAIAAELAASIGADPAYARIEVFVGPPGVGKTTTIAKIAARERKKRGPTLNIVSADGFRAGAMEQLRAYASIIRAPFRIARNSAELDDALTASRHPALVDTAGRAPDDREVTSLFDVLAAKRNVRTHLVLAADTSASTARKIFDRYGRLQPSRVVITKLDECDSATPLLGVIHDRQLPISYIGNGQRVPEDLARPTPQVLMAALLGEPTPEAATCH